MTNENEHIPGSQKSDGDSPPANQSDYDFIFAQQTPATKPKLSIKAKFFALPKARQLVLLTAVSVLMLSGIIVLVSSSTSHQSKSQTALQTTGATPQNAAEISSSTSSSTTNDADTSNSTSESSTSWWQKLLSFGNKTTATRTGSEGTSSYDSSDNQGDSTYTYNDEDDSGVWTDTEVATIPEASYQNTETKTQSTSSASFRVATYNIRTTSLNKWDGTRSNAILNYIKSVDIVGIQEGKDDSINWLKSKLQAAGYSNASYSNGGEYRAIFWKNSKFSALQQGSQTLYDGRNLTWVKLRPTSSNVDFYYMTTHLRLWTTTTSGGNTSDPSKYRVKEMKQILSFVKSNTASAPVILVGDMNSRQGSDVDTLVQSTGFHNSYSIADVKNNLAYNSSISNFTGGTTGTIHKGAGPIDHIFTKNGVKVKRVEIMIKQRGSDHLPVEADVTL